MFTESGGTNVLVIWQWLNGNMQFYWWLQKHADKIEYNQQQRATQQNDQVHIGHLNSKFSTIKEVHRGCTGIKEWSWFYQDFLLSLEQKSEIQRKNMEAQIQAHNVIDKLLLCLLMILC